MRLLAIACLLAACSGPPPMIDVDTTIDHWDGFGPPIVGDIDVRAILSSPTNELSHASGTIRIYCRSCTWGDGSKLKLEGLDEPIDWGERGEVEIGTIEGTLQFHDGKGIVVITAGRPETGTFVAFGDVSLANDVWKSVVEGHITWRVADALRVSDPRMYAVLSTTGASIDERGWYKVRVTGPLDSARRLAE